MIIPCWGHSMLKTVHAIAGLVLLASASTAAGGTSQARAHAAIVADILHADYTADLAGLLRLYDELAPPPEPTKTAARVRYWRGFARWRRAINGVNDGAPIDQMVDDLQTAVREFDFALDIDPQFIDAQAGLLSSLGIQLFLSSGDGARLHPLIDRARPRLTAARSVTHDNPRMIWVIGQAEWQAPAGWTRDQVLERQERVMASYVRGLALSRAQRPADSLDPAWGEPELLMNLAWSHLNKAVPDVAAADRYAKAALALVPHWHYVRDILVPQIEAARKKVR